MAGAGRKELRSLRLKAETTNGTPVQPRYVWRGPVDGIDDQREVVNPEEQVGIFGGTDRSYIPKLMAELPIPETEATFEQIADLLQMCGFGTSGGGDRAGSAQGASGSTAVFTLPIPVSSGPITYSYTAEVGDDAPGVERMEYCVCKELNLTFAGGQGMKVSATLMGRQGTPANAGGSFSLAGTLPLVEVILASRGSFYLSPVGGVFTANLVTRGNILAGNLKITPKWEPKFPVDAGQLYFHTAVWTGVDIEGELTLEHQISGTFGAAGSAGQVEKWRVEQPQLLQATWRGGTISEGTTYENKEFTFKVPMKWSKIDPLGDQNGNDIRVGKFYSKYNESTATAGRGTFLIARNGTSEMAGA
jgi:hypothetical protein